VKFESTYILTPQSLFSISGIILVLILLLSIHQPTRLLAFLFPKLVPQQIYFLDRCCIEQDDHETKVKELRLIPQILKKSNKLIVLLNENYFDRLWCCYEIAVFSTSTSVRDTDPVFVPTRLVALTLMLLVIDLLFVILFRSGLRTIIADSDSVAFLAISIGYACIVAALCVWFANWWYREVSHHEENLKKFSLSDTQCTDSDDREILVADIEKRFGSVVGFEEYVRTNVCGQIVKIKPQLGFMWFAAIPQFLSIFGYICVATQRIGLYCMRYLNAHNVPRDDLTCRILDREDWVNGVVIVGQIVRFLCFYPIAFALLLRACGYIESKFLSFGARFSANTFLTLFLAGYMIYDNWKFPEEYTGIVHSVNACVLIFLFSWLYILPRYGCARAS